ncbi:pyridine nucleotide-disulfide oxidoreductase [Tamaricihabitans halophyticus]|uniref:Pyridine nucleotide-disulfide oxidoreductase n=1 Tax=Tamaricihabitans halophyticus TaxID=1262583 RepID=A0A4R2QQG4_9PSEU|nr:NAD(P)-binding domain-containing protein [Tamaricihabitans halophyticus]TCP50918.1 pyridine nucleotide-disulfide oxidoreductase [Tamaricihabitans halophyticus]
MTRYLADFVDRHELRVRYQSRATGISADPIGYAVSFSDAPPVRARRVVIATGVEPYRPDIPGIDLVERYADLATDPSEFHAARVLIIGKGNSAFETASALIPVAATVHLASPSPVRLAWNTHYVGHVRAVNCNAIDTYQLKIGNALLDAEVTGIRRDGTGFHVDLAYTHAGGQRVTYQYDRVIAATGFRFGAHDLLTGLGGQTCHDGRYPAMTPDYECPDRPGLYFAGTLTHARDYRKAMSGFIHGFRYNSRFLARLLTAAGDLAPQCRIDVDAATLAQWVLDRLNTSDALYLQPGYFADVAAATDPDQTDLGVYEAVPLDWVRDGGLGSGWQLAVTLAYGPPAADPLNVDRRDDPSYADVTPYLHPVIRLRHAGVDTAELHLLEELENRYRPEEHLPRLTSFLRSALPVESVVS